LAPCLLLPKMFHLYRPLLEGDIDAFVNQDREDLGDALSNLALFVWWFSFGILFGILDYIEEPGDAELFKEIKKILIIQSTLGFIVGCLIAAAQSPFRN